MSDLEQSYLDEIDCRFPFEDWDRCVVLIDRGIAFSPNAAFGALHEICRPRAHADVATDLRIRLFGYWHSRFKHPVADLIGEAAFHLIRRRTLTAEGVNTKMMIVAPYRGQYAALAILYFCCEDPDERVERTEEEIRKSWTEAA